MNDVQQADRKRPLVGQPNKGEGSQPLDREAHVGTALEQRALCTAPYALEAALSLAREHRHRRASHPHLEAREVAVA